MNEIVKEFRKLLDVAKRLMEPDGCEWDRQQTLVSMRSSVLEEACEVIEAIDEEDDANLVEELGDLLYNVVFFCQLGEKEGRFTTEEVIRLIREKLIARHPHVFGETKLKDLEAIVEQWEHLKKAEKGHRESLMDGIPKGLPALARGHKIAGKMEKAGFLERATSSFNTEEELGAHLWEVVRKARTQGLNPENALRKTLLNEERRFRQWEQS